MLAFILPDAIQKCVSPEYLAELGLFQFVIALWSRGRVDGSHSEGPRFDPTASRKLFTISQMDVEG